MTSHPGRITRSIAAAVALVGLVAGGATAEDKADKFAVKSFSAKGVLPSDAASLESAFCTSLGNQGLDVLCPEDVRALLSDRQQKLGLTVGGGDKEDDENIAMLAKITSANRVITGELSKLGETYVFNATLLDPATNKVLVRASERTNKLDGLLDKLDAVAKKIAGK